MHPFPTLHHHRRRLAIVVALVVSLVLSSLGSGALAQQVPTDRDRSKLPLATTSWTVADYTRDWTDGTTGQTRAQAKADGWNLGRLSSRGAPATFSTSVWDRRCGSVFDFTVERDTCGIWDSAFIHMHDTTMVTMYTFQTAFPRGVNVSLILHNNQAGCETGGDGSGMQTWLMRGSLLSPVSLSGGRRSIAACARETYTFESTENIQPGWAILVETDCNVQASYDGHFFDFKIRAQCATECPKGNTDCEYLRLLTCPQTATWTRTLTLSSSLGSPSVTASHPTGSVSLTGSVGSPTASRSPGTSSASSSIGTMSATRSVSAPPTLTWTVTGSASRGSATPTRLATVTATMSTSPTRSTSFATVSTTPSLAATATLTSSPSRSGPVTPTDGWLRTLTVSASRTASRALSLTPSVLPSATTTVTRGHSGLLTATVPRTATVGATQTPHRAVTPTADLTATATLAVPTTLAPTPPPDGTPGALSSVSSTLLPEAAAEPKPLIPTEDLEESTDASTAVAGAVGSPVSALSLQRIALLSRFCAAFETEPLDWIDSPTRVAIGSDRTRYHVGAVVMNCLLMTAVPLVLHLLTYGYAAVLETTLEHAYGKLRTAHLQLFVVLLLTQPTVGSMVVAMTFATSAGPAVGSTILGVLVLIAVFSTFIVLLRRFFFAYFVSVDDDDDDVEKSDAASKRASPESSPAAAYEADGGEQLLMADPHGDPSSTKRRRHKPPMIARVLQWLFIPCGDWYHRQPDPAVVNDRWPAWLGRRIATVKDFSVLFDPFFADYRAPHHGFMMVEMGATVLLAVTQALAQSSGCRVGAPILLVVTVGYFVLLVVRRPHATQFDRLFMCIMAALQGLAAAAQTVSTFLATQSSEDAVDSFVFMLQILAVVRAVYDIAKLFIRLSHAGEKLATAHKNRWESKTDSRDGEGPLLTAPSRSPPPRGEEAYTPCPAPEVVTSSPTEDEGVFEEEEPGVEEEAAADDAEADDAGAPDDGGDEQRVRVDSEFLAGATDSYVGFAVGQAGRVDDEREAAAAAEAEAKRQMRMDVLSVDDESAAARARALINAGREVAAPAAALSRVVTHATRSRKSKADDDDDAWFGADPSPPPTRRSVAERNRPPAALAPPRRHAPQPKKGRGAAPSTIADLDAILEDDNHHTTATDDPSALPVPPGDVALELDALLLPESALPTGGGSDLLDELLAGPPPAQSAGRHRDAGFDDF